MAKGWVPSQRNAAPEPREVLHAMTGGGSARLRPWQDLMLGSFIPLTYLQNNVDETIRLALNTEKSYEKI